MVNETVTAIVAFIDICGFTAMSEKETPDNVVKLLNRYFDLMVKEIIDQGGMVDKFIGDCVIWLFPGRLSPRPGDRRLYRHPRQNRPASSEYSFHRKFRSASTAGNDFGKYRLCRPSPA